MGDSVQQVLNHPFTHCMTHTHLHRRIQTYTHRDEHRHTDVHRHTLKNTELWTNPFIFFGWPKKRGPPLPIYSIVHASEKTRLYFSIFLKTIFVDTFSFIKLIERKDYFRITLCSDLMYNRDIKGYKFVCVRVEDLAFDVSLHTKSEQKMYR